jgi:Tol biopolymer transport system component/DNA-binding winged helix-turn-helix (wHTH) protein
MSRQPSAVGLIRFGVFELDVAAGELRKQGRKINLQQQPCQVLALLLRRPGELVTREELQQGLWPADTFVEFDQGLNTTIKKIRQALDDSADNPRFIETLPRKGYRFIAPVSGGESPAPAAGRGRRLLFTAATLVLIAVAGAAGWLLNKPNKTNANETADAAIVPIPLTSYPGSEVHPSFSPDGNQVAFQWDQMDGTSWIYVKLVGASEPLRLTKGCCPAWSPDGRSIAFVKFEPKGDVRNGKSRAGVFLISPLGGPEQKLADLDSGLGFAAEIVQGLAWHPSGKWLVVSDHLPGGRYGLLLLSMESREKQALISPPVGSSDSFPVFSPDGEALVFSRGSVGNDGDLYLLELSEGLQPKGEPRRITSENTYNNQAAWTPDGHSIVFGSCILRSRGLREVSFAQPGWRPGKPSRLAPFAGQIVWTPSISRQGRLAYATITVGADIWRLELNGGRPATKPAEPLIASTWLDHVPVYSPDGKRIAFASNRSGSHEIWVCNSDGSGAMPLTSFGGSEYTSDPRWSPDGRQILFHSNPEGHAQTYIVDSDGGKPKPLPANFDVDSGSLDGKWVYFTADNQVLKRPWSLSGQDGDAVPITRKGGTGARESRDGRMLYYLKPGEEITSLWRVPVEGGEETQVLESVAFGNFAVVEQGIYFIPGWSPEGNPVIRYLSFATGKVETIATLSKEGAAYGFAVSPDSRWLLYSQYRPSESDLWIVENFR